MWSRTVEATALAPFVERLWFCQIDDAQGTELVLPTGRAQLVFGLRCSSHGASIYGPSLTAREVDAAAQQQAVGVSFRIGGLSGVVSGAVESYVDRVIAIEHVLGQDGELLWERLAGEVDPASMLAEVERFLTRLVHAVGRPPDPAVRCAMAMLTRGRRVGDTAQALGLDSRTLVSRFRSELGMEPKRFARLRRFESALTALRHRDAANLATIATAMGYSDQAHMTREIREFSSLTPSALHRDSAASPTHVFDRAFLQD